MSFKNFSSSVSDTSKKEKPVAKPADNEDVKVTTPDQAQTKDDQTHK